jgi:hypothetical protein
MNINTEIHFVDILEHLIFIYILINKMNLKINLYD